MERAKHSLNVVKAKSEELGIPFVNLLSAFVLEQAFLQIAQSQKKELFLLRNKEESKLELYRRKVVNRLDYYVREPSGQIKRELETIFSDSKKKEICWEMTWVGQGVKQDEKREAKPETTQGVKQTGKRLLLTGKIEEIAVPLELTFLEIDPHVQGQKAEYRIFFETDKRVPYLFFPAEMMVTDCITEILSKMELLGDMARYQQVYEILSRESMNGRRIREQLVEKLEKAHVTPDEKRMDMFRSYGSYPYMKKKWKAQLKKEKKNSPQWEEVFQKVLDFSEPIWSALCKDEIFFGDWMPELGRFL